jgi:ABC-type multidrug transport system ATPase subunit
MKIIFLILKVYDKDLDSDMDEIRRSVGLCTQRDVLYDNLRFEETLRFFGKIKGVSGTNLDQEVEYILQKTGSTGDRFKFTKELSGGNKR